MAEGGPKYRFEFYTTANGRRIVRDEIRSLMGQGPPRKELGELLSRIQWDRQLADDTGHLGDGLWEARLSFSGNAYRLYYAHESGDAVLLGVHFAQKGGRGAQDRAIRTARQRLGDWKRRSR